MTVEIRPITGENFRDVLDLEVSGEQSAWVAPTARYLAVCAYGGTWHPLGLYTDGTPVGFAMWARDPADGSHWIGGFLVDLSHQGRGHGRAAMVAIMDYLRSSEGAKTFALSYAPDNAVARHLYASLGFVETGERDDDELVARLSRLADGEAAKGVSMSEYADSTRLSATYVVTADDLVATNRLAERGALPMLYIAAAIGIPIGVVLIAWNPVIGALAIGLCIGVAILPQLPGFWRWWLTRQAGDLLGERRHFVFDAEGFHEEQAGILRTTPWDLLTLMRVTRDGVFLLHDRHVVLAVPARAFSSPDDVDRLINLVSANASRVRIA